MLIAIFCGLLLQNTYLFTQMKNFLSSSRLNVSTESLELFLHPSHFLRWHHQFITFLKNPHWKSPIKIYFNRSTKHKTQSSTEKKSCTTNPYDKGGCSASNLLPQFIGGTGKIVDLNLGSHRCHDDRFPVDRTHKWENWGIKFYHQIWHRV